MDTTQIAEKLELHYFFEDRSHSMDAFVRNQCEAELLEIVKTVVSVAGLDVDIESFAHAEGGLKDLWNILSKNQGQITVLLLILTLISSRFPPVDKTQREINTRKTLLEIRKLENELGLTADQKIPNIEKVVEIAVSDTRIIKRKSNFYSYLLGCSKVSKLSWARLDKWGEPVDKPEVVNRVDFKDFILTTDELEPVVDEEAVIEIIAPVLKAGSYKWRGIYQGESISFKVKDSSFRADVLAGGVSFINGTCIDCVLIISRKLDDCGVEQNSGYTVQVVTKVHDEKASVETPQGKKYKRKQELERNSMEFDFEQKTEGK